MKVLSQKRIAKMRRELKRKGMREKHEELVGRAKYLPESERVLLCCALDRGVSFDELAQLVGDESWDVRRKIRKLMKNVDDPGYVLVTQKSELVPKEILPLARGYFVEGLSLRECAQRFEVTLHRVRVMLLTVRGLLRWARQAA